jgi:hypothetical protein
MSQLFVYKTRLFWYTEKGNAGKVLPGLVLGGFRKKKQRELLEEVKGNAV